MTMRKTLGGERLGAGKKMKVDLKTYDRSTHDLGYLWRSTMAPGTLVPFLVEVGLPGDTFDIDLDCIVKTHPTVGPLFGSYKVQLDILTADIRLYQGQLHNNKLKIGMKMSDIKLPTITMEAANPVLTKPLDNQQINPSCIFSYLGIRGIGRITGGQNTSYREFNGVPFLAYWDIYKNYYANKQEEFGAVIHQAPEAVVNTVTSINVSKTANTGANIAVPQAPGATTIAPTKDSALIIVHTGAQPKGYQIILNTSIGNQTADQLFGVKTTSSGTQVIFTEIKNT